MPAPPDLVPRRAIVLLVVGLALGAATAAQLPTDGNLLGVVVGPEGETIAGVTVTLRGDVGARTGRCDERGRFSFRGLSPGTYALLLELQGHGRLEVAGVEVRAGRDTELRVALPAALEETVRVRADEALLDTRGAPAPTTLNHQELDTLPTGEDPWALLRHVPFATVDRVDVAGNESGSPPQLRGPAVADDQNDYQLDGIPVNTLWTGGSALSYAGLVAYDEVRYSTGGSDVTQRTPGVTTSLVTRRGTNRARGSAAYHVTDADGYFGGAFPQSSPDIGADDLGVGQGPIDGSRTEKLDAGGVELGGPIVADRLWAWGAYESHDISTLNVESRPFAVSLDSVHLRLDSQISPNNSLRATWAGSSREETAVNTTLGYPPEATFDDDNDVDIYGLFDAHVFSPRVFSAFLASYGHGGPVWTAHGGSGPDAPEAWIDATNLWRDGFHSGWAGGESRTLQVDTTWLVDGGGPDHELRFGARRRESEHDGRFSYPGRNLYTTAPFVVAVRGFSTPPSEQQNLELWAQDLLRFSNLTLSLGLRYDRQEGRNRAVQVPANPAFPDILPALDYPGSGADLEWEAVSPRLGATWDVGGGGKTYLRASLATFTDQLLRNALVHTNPVAISGGVFFFVGGEKYGDEPAFLVSPFGFDPTKPAALESPNEVAPDLDGPKTSELTLGVDRALGRTSTLSLSLVARRVEDLLENHTLVRDGEGAIRELRVDDWIPDGSISGIVPGTNYGYEEPIFAQPSDLQETGGTLLLNGQREREYLGATLSLDRRFSDGWRMRAFCHWNEAEWTVPQSFRDFADPNRRWAGGDRDEDLFIIGSFGAPGTVIRIVPRERGIRFPQSGWNAGVTGMVRVAPQRAWGFDLSGSLTGRQGFPIPLGAHAFTSDGHERFVGVSHRLDDFRLADVVLLDLRLSKEVRLRDGLSISVNLDGYNLANHTPAQARVGNLSIGHTFWVEDTVSPRIYRLGLRLRWN